MFLLEIVVARLLTGYLLSSVIIANKLATSLEIVLINLNLPQAYTAWANIALLTALVNWILSVIDVVTVLRTSSFLKTAIILQILWTAQLSKLKLLDFRRTLTTLQKT